MKPTTLGWRAQLARGIALMALACGCAVIDIINNYAYGIAVSPVLAGLMVFAAIGVVAIPAIAGDRIRSWYYFLPTAAAVAMTVWCAYHAYSSKQTDLALSSQNRQEIYLKAKAKEARAAATLDGIKLYIKDNGLLGTVKELAILADKADQAEAAASKRQAVAETASQKPCRRPASDDCKEAKETKAKAAAARSQAEADARKAHERLSQAETRDKAEADLVGAEAESANGQVQVRQESEVLTWLGIGFTQLMALLGGKGAEFIGTAWSVREQQPAKKSKPRGESAEQPAAAEPDILARIKALVRAQPDRVLRMSIRELAEELGVKRAGLHGRLGKYRNDGALDVTVEGKGRASATVIRLPAKKKAA